VRQNDAMYVVIMAGGGGTRLRPMSTAARPKPFLPLLPDGRTLLQRTVDRLLGGDQLALTARQITVVAAAGYAPLVRSQVPEVPVLEEPEGRNTAAAIALAAFAIDRDADDVMVVLPADHLMLPEREGMFRDVLRTAATRLATGAFGIDEPLVTLGVEVTRPATEYGYLRPDVERGRRIDGLDAYPLLAFEEKPTPARARELQREVGVAWNAGMFLWQRRAIRRSLERYAPDVSVAIERGVATGDLAAAYARLRARSIDYEVMEPAAADRQVVMGSMAVGWNDIGTWPALLDALGTRGIEGRVVEPGDPVATTADDLVIERAPAGLVVGAGTEGTITPRQPIAVLHGARAARPIVQALLDRCAAAEARS
jgi:mannose-1-phosphate guanylyltransferase